MSDTFFYESSVEWKQGSRGEVRSPGLPPLEVASPPEFGGETGLWTPEHLYVASVGSCFLSTFCAVAAKSRLDFLEFKVDGRGKLEKIEGQLQMTTILLRPRLVLLHQRDLERAYKVLEKAKSYCLISNSIRTAVDLEPLVLVADSEQEQRISHT